MSWPVYILYKGKFVNLTDSLMSLFNDQIWDYVLNEDNILCAESNSLLEFVDLTTMAKLPFHLQTQLIKI